MEVKVKQIDKFKFNIKARSHAVISDQPAENGGEDEGMTSAGVDAGFAGACAEFYAVQYLRTRKLDERGVEVTVGAES